MQPAPLPPPTSPFHPSPPPQQPTTVRKGEIIKSVRGSGVDNDKTYDIRLIESFFSLKK